MKEKTIKIYDSTLRDGAQGEGINFTLENKLAVVKILDEFGVSYIEAGNPGSNPKDIAFFERANQLELKHAQLAAFGSTRRKNIEAKDDANVISLLTANTPVVAIFGKCWDLHVIEIVNTTLEENLNMIKDTVAFFVSNGKTVVFDAEHFFDGYKHNPKYALQCLKAAHDGGASVLCLCETNGGAFPQEVFEICTVVKNTFPDTELGIHTHNDGGLGVANSLEAVRAGFTQVQGTMIGFGERTGNANLSTVIANLQVKQGCKCVPDAKELTTVAREIADIANITLENNMPFVGLSAFTHKAGMHADGVLKVSHSFEHIDPSLVGNSRRFVMSEFAGRTALVKKIAKYFPQYDKDSAEVKSILAHLKELEFDGYQFEGAEASFLTVVLKTLKLYQPFFELISFKIINEMPAIENVSATAIIKIRVQDKTKLSSSEGDGPVNALDLALRKALSAFYPAISNITLVDYKVRVLDGADATASKVRVLITSSDGKHTWSNVGVSTDIVQASYLALVESMEFKLIMETTNLLKKH